MERWIKDIRKVQNELAELANELGMGRFSRLLPTGEAPRVDMDIREPYMDMRDTGDEIVFTFEMPGVKKEDIDLSLTETMLRIDAKREEEVEESKGAYLYRERTYRGYHRTIPLPAEVDADRAEATFRNGVLDVRLPKKTPEKLSKIDVK